MDDFRYVDGRLFCEDVAVEEIAREAGTPVYIYSRKTLERHFKVFDEAFSGMPHIVCFAMKANSNQSVVGTFAKLGGGADVVSGGELFRAMRAGVPADRIVYAGVGKTVAEIEYALNSGILMFNIESEDELLTIDETAGRLGVKARVALRINPDVDARTHPYISTGLKKNKFGIAIEHAMEGYRTASALSNIEVVGIHQHIGSQLTETGPFVDSLKKTVELVARLKDAGVDIKYIDVGGGLGIKYLDEDPPHPSELADALMPVLEGVGCTLIFEPGRVLVGNAGCLVTKVLYRKATEVKNFVIVDAGMNDLVRPTLYQAYHAVKPVMKKDGPEYVADVVGPICETGDFLAKDRTMTVPEGGDLLAVMSAGAYGFTMSSNYNSRPRAAEVMVSGNSFQVVRKRETYEDLVRGETAGEF
ncbi:MAG: diaminopimelate decarboxylase [Nitrospirae bacterium]|nr:diaminopimelate decarboxylase [Nitrospirota bacterium]